MYGNNNIDEMEFEIANLMGNGKVKVTQLFNLINENIACENKINQVLQTLSDELDYEDDPDAMFGPFLPFNKNGIFFL